MYHFQGRYYDPVIGRFISANLNIASISSILSYNMYVCDGNSNASNFVEPSPPYVNGYYKESTIESGKSFSPDPYGPNIEYLMAFYGVTSPSDVPALPDGAMIFVENMTSTTVGLVTIVEGRTIVFDEYRYCEYFFSGIGVGLSASLPIDKTITQGYVYGLKDVDDYCGWFVGLSFASAAMAQGGAFASREIYAVITNGTSTGVSLGLCRTYYFTAQSKWIYGKANMTTVIVPVKVLRQDFHRQTHIGCLLLLL